jgi:hypothetical protein
MYTIFGYVCTSQLASISWVRTSDPYCYRYIAIANRTVPLCVQCTICVESVCTSQLPTLSPSVILFIISDLDLPRSPGIFQKNILPFKFYHQTNAMACNHQHRHSNWKHRHGCPLSGASQMPPTDVSQERTAKTTGNASSRLQHRSFNEGIASPPATITPEHGHYTCHAASLCIADASRYHESQIPVTTVAVFPGSPASRYLVSTPYIDVDIPPPALSFWGTPI